LITILKIKIKMNPSGETISHPGVITSVDDLHVKVKIASAAACGSCSVKSACGMSEMEDKIIDILREPYREYKAGEAVTVFMKQSLGPLAVFFGYILPFVAVLVTLIIMLQLGFGEGVSGLVSLGMLAPYYIILYFTRNRLKKTFRFYIK
jgi:sigma-E factor negative regulatory protein RseC